MNLLEDLRRIKQVMILESKKKWTIKGGKLNKTYKFKDFKEASAFVNKVATLSEEENHHPEIIWMYNTVELNLSTHDKGDEVTDKDRRLSDRIDSIS